MQHYILDHNNTPVACHDVQTFAFWMATNPKRITADTVSCVDSVGCVDAIYDIRSEYQKFSPLGTPTIQPCIEAAVNDATRRDYKHLWHQLMQLQYLVSTLAGDVWGDLKFKIGSAMSMMVRVSTVFTGIDNRTWWQKFRKVPAMMWETRVFGGQKNGTVILSLSAIAAEAVHRKMVVEAR